MIESKDGRLLIEPEMVIERWKEYCLELYNHVPMNDSGTADSLQNSQEHIEELLIIKKEVEEAIRRLKNGKTAGVDNIPGEIIRGGGARVTEVLHWLCGQIMITNVWPTQWVQSITIPLPKKAT